MVPDEMDPFTRFNLTEIKSRSIPDHHPEHQVRSENNYENILQNIF
jgi:hypothetical protein